MRLNLLLALIGVNKCDTMDQCAAHLIKCNHNGGAGIYIMDVVTIYVTTLHSPQFISFVHLKTIYIRKQDALHYLLDMRNMRDRKLDRLENAQIARDVFTRFAKSHDT